MIKVENVDVWGFEHAIRGMRNALASWHKSDTPLIRKTNVPRGYGTHGNFQQVDVVEEMFVEEPTEFSESFVIGDNDLDLMRRLFKAGDPSHRKYARQIFVSMDITSNHTWWAEFDTYKIGTTRNSCSKMHRIHVKEFVPDDFSHEGIDEVGGKVEEHFLKTIEILEWLRVKFNETHEKKYWRAIIDLLPMGYNLRATVTMTYENVFNIIRQREGHKIFEWGIFLKALKALPYVKEITEGV